MKICYCCKHSLDESQFNKSNRTKDELRGECRKCQHEMYKTYAATMEAKQAKKKWRQSSKGQAIHTASDRKRNRTEHRRTYKKESSHLPAYRANKNRWMNKYRTTPKGILQTKVHSIVRNALKYGALERGSCELEYTGECSGKIQAHHDDYSQPLIIRWLCVGHHTNLHRPNKH